MKTSECDDCRGIGGYIGRDGAWARSPGVVRRWFVPRASANPFDVEDKVFWPKSENELKSKTTIFSHNLLHLFDLHQFLKTLTGQQWCRVSIQFCFGYMTIYQGLADEGRNVLFPGFLP
jgi:hypothetical protein